MLISFVLWSKEIARFCADEEGEGLYRDADSLAGTWWPVETVEFLLTWRYNVTYHS